MSADADPFVERPLRVPLWLVDAGVVLAVCLLAVVPYPTRPPEAANVAVVAAQMLAGGATVLRRRWPLAVAAGVGAVYVALLLVGVASPGTALALTVAVFGAARLTSRRTAVQFMVWMIGAVLGASLLADLWLDVDPHVFQLVVVLAFATAAGDASRSRQAFLEAMRERALTAESTREAEARRRVSEERLRIARDLHDAVAHQIAVISLNAGVATQSLDAHPEKSREALGIVRAASRTVLAEIGSLMTVLRSTADADADEQGGGLGAGLQPQPSLDRLQELIGSFESLGLEVRLRSPNPLGKLPGAVDMVAYKVVQEGLTNAHKHGSGRAMVVIERGDDALTVVVTNPIGSAHGQADRSSGFGLVGLRERAASVRGTLEAGLAPGGFRLAARLPIDPEERG